MAEIKTPRTYHSKPDAIAHLGEFAGELGARALILGGKTALALVAAEVTAQLDVAGISHQVQTYGGRPTPAASKQFQDLANQQGADFIVGVGGGRVIDTAKLAAFEAGLPVITVPTVAATCASFSATIVTYDDMGVSTGFFVPPQSPVAVFADTEIMALAPTRYLKAGLADTLAKWYENLPLLAVSDSLFLHQQLATARLAVDVIVKHAPSVLTQLEVTEQEDRDARRALGHKAAFIELVDAVILLAGLVGCITANTDYAGLAHPFYTASTHLRQMDTCLHGERVAYGLLVQAVALEESKDHIEELVELLKLLEQPLTLAEMGVAQDDYEALHVLARNTVEHVQTFRVSDNHLDVAYLKEVFARTDTKRYWSEASGAAASPTASKTARSEAAA